MLGGKIRSFEGIRGCLALLVCLGHYGMNNAFERIGLHVHFELAVDVFFALSGFVLSHTNYFGKKSWTEFSVGRFARLYPLHLLTLLAIAGIFAAMHKPFDVKVFFAHLFLVHNIGLPFDAFDFNFPSWSISVEFWLSLAFFPLLCLKPQRMFLLLPLLSLVIVLAFPGFQTHMGENFRVYFNAGLLRGVAGFSVGVAAYLYCRYVLEHRQLPLWVPRAALAALAVTFCRAPTTIADSLLLYAVIFLVLVSLANRDERMLLAGSVGVFLGSISYSIYLLHIPLVRGMELLFSPEALRGVHKLPVIFLLVPLAAAVYRYIERPAQRFILGLLPAAKKNAPVPLAAEMTRDESIVR